MFAQLSRTMGTAAAAADLPATPDPHVDGSLALPPAPRVGIIPASTSTVQAAPPAGALHVPPLQDPLVTPVQTPLPSPLAVASPLVPASMAAPAGPDPVYPGDNDRPIPGATGALQSHVDSFVSRLGASAQAASAASGVPAPLILAQAALESGWGRREIRGADGAQSFNLFGIKADRGWRGAVVETATTEYVDGVAQRVQAKFRAYGSYEEAFTDYAQFLTRNPRYAKVLGINDAAEAAQALQRAGYATDPNYGNKLVRIIQKIA
jgi:flagellar protein FlgJ